MKRFENKVCLVTGAGSGIGKATALAFATEAANVVVVDVNVSAAEEVAAFIKNEGGNAMAVMADISRRPDVSAMMEKTMEVFGRLDCAVNCAGIAGKYSLPVHEYPEEDWVNMILVNLVGTYYCVKEQIKQMLVNGEGNIVNVASAAGLVGQPFNSPYAASKFGIVGLTRTAAREYATQNIRVNAVCPTAIETPMIMEGRRKLAYDPVALEAAKNYQAMKRMGRPEEVAQVILWLCSDKSSFITGHAMPVDGGAFA